MIKTRMERLVLGERQFGDVVWIAAGFMRIATIGEEKFHRLPKCHGIRIREHALHLRIDNAVANEFSVSVEFVVPSLLIQRHRILHGKRMQHSVHVHVNEIQEVGVIARCHWIDGLVRIRHRVQERCERTLEQIDKRFLYGIFLRSAQDGMLHDMRDTRIVLGNGFERHCESFILVFALEPDEFSPVLLVCHTPKTTRNLGKFGCGLYGKVVNRVVQFHCMYHCCARDSCERDYCLCVHFESLLMSAPRAPSSFSTAL